MRQLVALLAFALLISTTSAVFAQESPAQESFTQQSPAPESFTQESHPRFRLDLDTTLFSFARSTVALDSQDEDTEEYTSTFIGFGDGLVGNSVQTFGLGIGFLPIKDLAVGAKLQLGGGAFTYEDSFFGDDGEQRAFSYGVLPFVEYKFSNGSIQPFILATAGYRGSVVWYDDNDDDKYFVHLFEFGGAVGTHFFMAKNVSVDVKISATGDFGKMGLSDNDDEKVDISSFRLGTSLGLSGWF